MGFYVASTYRSNSQTYESVRTRCLERKSTYIAKISVQHLYVAMYDLQSHKFIVCRPNAAYKEEGRITAVHDFGIYLRDESMKPQERGASKRPLYSRKLHMRVRRPRTNWVTSFTILVFALGGMVVNHLARRTLPVILGLHACNAYALDIRIP